MAEGSWETLQAMKWRRTSMQGGRTRLVSQTQTSQLNRPSLDDGKSAGDVITLPMAKVTNF